MKFKVGDRVRCIKDVCKYKTENKTGTVKNVYNDILCISFDEIVNGWKDERLGIKKGHGVAVNEKDLELIEENADTFTLDDLKVGYLVELRNGELHIIMQSICGSILIDRSGAWLNLNIYNNNLNHKNGNTNFDIIKVYGFDKAPSLSLDFFTENRELLWERKEILNYKEKEYLSSFIKPFRDRVKYISKYFNANANDYFISIEYKNDLDMNFPYFLNKKMYKGMELNKKYTLKELGL